LINEKKLKIQNYFEFLNRIFKIKMQQSFDTILQVFEIETRKSVNSLPEETLYSVLHRALSKRIAELLSHNPEQLKGILYRIDVPEQKLLEALAVHPSEEASGIIAQMIIEREEAKAKTREKYRTNDNKEENAFLDL